MCMKLSRDELINKFLRSYLKPFTAKEMKKLFISLGYSITIDEIEDLLSLNPNVLELENEKYITYAGAFTGEIFSFVPTPAEVAQGVLVPGDRCMPFVEPDRISSTLKFYVNGKKIPYKVGVFDSNTAADMFVFFGAEYASQYIAADPANSSLNLVDRDFELPGKVNLTGLDLEFLANYGYKKGDRILCCVTDWAEGKLNIMIIHTDEKKFDKGEIGEKRLEWFAMLEKKLLELFDTKGPMSSIEEQLVNVYFENRQDICVPYCGSVEELMFKFSKKIGFEQYGVETRIWRKDEDVPAFGNWNRPITKLTKDLKNHISFSLYTLNSIPEFIYDQLVLDVLYSKQKDFLSYIIDFICQDDFILDDLEFQNIALSLKERYNILSTDYNWFADQIVGSVRKRALELYKKVSSLLRKIDFLGEEVFDFPSQEVVILAQLHGHILRMIESLATDPTIENDAEALKLSLDGMEWNFEDIREVLETSLEKVSRNHFKLVKL